MANWWKTSDWEQSHPWLAGLINGSIVTTFVGIGGWMSDSNSQSWTLAVALGAAVAVVRGLLLSREKNKSSS